MMRFWLPMIIEIGWIFFQEGYPPIGNGLNLGGVPPPCQPMITRGDNKKPQVIAPRGLSSQVARAAPCPEGAFSDPPRRYWP